MNQIRNTVAKNISSVLTLLITVLTGFQGMAQPQRVIKKPIREHKYNVAEVYQTSKDTAYRLSKMNNLSFSTSAEIKESRAAVFLDPSKTFQTIVGIGGAFTDAAAETFYKLPAIKRQQLIEAYFDKEKGIGYSLGRTHINSCDFSSKTYTYVEDGDTALKTFSIKQDKVFRIPFIKEAIDAAKGDLTVYASPWSPPAWMKTNGDMLKGGQLKPEFNRTWAKYFVNFIKAYQKEGIPIWGITVQNEPASVQRWESCIYTAEMERDFIKNHLGPVLKKEGLGDKKIIAWDHNRGLLYQRASVILDDAEAAKYVWGIGFHWYTGNHFENVKIVQESYPKVNLIFTEGCNEAFKYSRMSDWVLGERYGKSIINDFNNGAVGWTDWNIILDENGGPNHVKNFCFAPVHGDTKSGELIFTNAYYYLGHFSKFIRPGARRITSATTVDDLMVTAFMNADKSIVVVVMNPSLKQISYDVWLKGMSISTSVLPRSIMTLVIK